MKKRSLRLIALGVVALLVAAAGTWIALGMRMPRIESAEKVERTPNIYPDYVDVVIPPNLAPMNFMIDEAGEVYAVTIASTNGDRIRLHGRGASVRIPSGAWRELLQANRGEELTIDVAVRDGKGRWYSYQPIVNRIAPEEIDGYLVYRDMGVYNLVWNDMGIYQRDLSGFDRREVLRNNGFDRGCCNCHTFVNNRPDGILFHVRGNMKGKSGELNQGMVIVRQGKPTRVVNTKTNLSPIPARYIAWHPSGESVAFSTNNALEIFHSKGPGRTVVDAHSDMAVYLIESNTVTTCPAIARGDRLETYPAWSPDGKYLYYCSAPQHALAVDFRRGRNEPVIVFKGALYDLMRVRCNPAKGEWGTPEVVLSAEDAGGSIALPRISPDGRLLLCCVLSDGNFAPFDPASDLLMLDLETHEHRRLAINSPYADSYHSWSSNGRWIVFTSKRGEGEFARPYISYVDEDGKVYKPILVPQEDPAFYRSDLRIFNVPELITSPIPFSQRQILDGLYSPDAGMQAQLAPGIKPNETVLKLMGRDDADATPMQ